MTKRQLPNAARILSETSDSLSEQVMLWQKTGGPDPDDSLCRAVLDWVDSVRGMVIDHGLDEEFDDIRIDFLMHLRRRKNHLGDLDLREPAWHWFAKVFRNFLRDRCRMRTRSARRRDTIGIDSLGQEPPSDTPSPFDEMAGRELADFVRTHMDGPNGKLLELAMLGYTPKEIAEKLVLTRGSVRMRLCRARLQLNELLGELT